MEAGKKKQMRSRDEWRVLLQDWRKSGLNPSAWCRLKGISHSVWARWQQRLEDGGLFTSGKSDSKAEGSFIPVRLRAGPTASMTPVTGVQIELTLTSGHRMQIQGMDEQQLLSLVQRLVT